MSFLLLLLQTSMATGFQADEFGFLNAVSAKRPRDVAQCVATGVRAAGRSASVAQHTNVFRVTDDKGVQIAIGISFATAKTTFFVAGSEGAAFVANYSEVIKSCL
jgi:hypothetical protein